MDIEEITNILGEKYEYTYKTVGGIDMHLVQTVRKTDASNNTLTLTYGYDAYGNTTSSTLTSTGSTGKITSGATYTDNGNRLSTVTDATGGTTSYAYNGYGQTSGVTDAKGVRIGFLYDTRRRLIGTYLDANKDAIANASEPAVRYAYDSEGYLQKIETDGTDYTFGYDHHGNVLTVKAGNYTLATNTYGPFDGALQTSTTGNGLKTTYEYDRLGRLAGVKENGAQLYSLTYNGDGQAARLVDNASGETTEYEYDGAGRLIRANRTSSSSGASLLSAENVYDSYGRAKSTTYLLPNQTQKYTLAYQNKSSLLSTIYLPDPTESAIISYHYDKFERLSFMYLTAFNMPDIQTTYQYVDRTDGSTTYTSNRIAEESLSMANGSVSFAYTYDANGNITEIKKNSTPQVTYEYDSLGQLVREYNHETQLATVFVYDKSGNVTDRYTFTGFTAEVPISHLMACYPYGCIDEASYTYGSSGWGDLLTDYDGTSITYDASGNPKNWKGISELLWTGNRLTEITLSNATASSAYKALWMQYDANGIRTSKQYVEHVADASSYTVTYTTDGTKILSEQRTGTNPHTIYYVYDANGSVVGMKYNGVQYWYHKNIQGDVLGIMNANGVEVVSYAYDAWGKVLSVSGSLSSTVGAVNPFRYRGYYYDVETGWYYLNARYYDPNVGRFINADSQLNTSLGVVGANLYVYCLNNSVNMIDVIGKYPQFINDQNDNVVVPGSSDTMKDISWVWGNISENGCGVIAVYNVMAVTNRNYSFIQVRDIMLYREAALFFGLLGVNPLAIAPSLALLDGQKTQEHWGYDRNEWISTANTSDQIIVLYKYSDTLAMHYVAGIRCIGPGNGAYKDHYFLFINDPYVSDPFRQRLTMAQYLDILESKGCTPIWMAKIYK